MFMDKVFTNSTSEGLNAITFFSFDLSDADPVFNAPAAVTNTIGVKTQTFSVVGPPFPLQTTDLVFVAQPPGAIGADCVAIGGHVTAAGSIAITFLNLTAVANVPAPGVYGFLVVRP